MDAQEIERMARKRWRLLLWTTVGIALWWPSLAFSSEWDNSVARIVLGFMMFAGWWIWLIAFIQLMKLWRKMAKDPKLKEALANEKYKANVRKSFVFGFWFMIGTALVVGCLARILHVAVPVAPVCYGLAYVGIISALVSNLIINRIRQ